MWTKAAMKQRVFTPKLPDKHCCSMRLGADCFKAASQFRAGIPATTPDVVHWKIFWRTIRHPPRARRFLVVHCWKRERYRKKSHANAKRAQQSRQPERNAHAFAGAFPRKPPTDLSADGSDVCLAHDCPMARRY